ncbi:MAG: type II toxin-antitoxin system VapC family toxin [Rhodomicrobium sp.]
MIYHLDTNAVIAVLNNRPETVRERLKAVLEAGHASSAISSIVLYELRYGAARSAQPQKNAERLRAFLAGPVDVIQFAEEDAAVAGDLRAVLEAAGTPVGPYDLLIAAQALRSGATLITANTREFTRVPGLVIENWCTGASA